jgi:hypothetical protein
MHRRLLIASGAAFVASSAFADTAAPDIPNGPTSGNPPPPPPAGGDNTYSSDELVKSASNFLGAAAETVATVIEKTFKDNGRPTGYIEGSEYSAALVLGLRYGNGYLSMKNRPKTRVFWRGPTAGFDAGGNGSRCFTLCYNLDNPDEIFQRFPGVEGTGYFIGGLALNYQPSDKITLAPIRAGVGLRLGANAGYLAYSRKGHWLPL